MDAIELIKTRRSVRKFKENPVDRETMHEIIDIARWAPSWANTQIARYTLVDNPEMIQQIAGKGVKGFAYNMKTLANAPGVCVLSHVEGKSGRIDPAKLDIELSDPEAWESFDAGIACQTFCLAAHALGVGTCIFGVIDKETLPKLLNLPEGETVSALIVYGWPDETPNPTPRMKAYEILRFI
ncbi:nitroreductase family protein [Pontiella agarivorans]|uniref:Nitroreductase family protein n=1 Tax=Pontiella agarivorans TaxID=3038953 RepID=A0ABU5MXH2_9BACT|nr:nitroreductase family protein [Pontiella agarivorans]MDZ8118893.1 nitroreductase family protein [Pontiella agarivorans]